MITCGHLAEDDCKRPLVRSFARSLVQRRNPNQREIQCEALFCLIDSDRRDGGDCRFVTDAEPAKNYILPPTIDRT